MAVRLRLRRIGKKKMPMYQIVAADSRAARNGKFLEVVGRYEPLQRPMVIAAKEDRVFHWLKRGALPTDTVRSLLQRNGLWMKWSMTKKGNDEGTIAAAMEKWQLAQAEKTQRDEERRARRASGRRKKKGAEAVAETPAPPAAETPAAT
ncbi:MAG: 30S ribosomal protein S16 [Ignavibacteria bacterium]|nr:30S ribosomal protein S16 [Ignavibacteria bacterium]